MTKTAITYLKSLKEFMFGGSYNLYKRWVIQRKWKDFDIVVPKRFWWEFKDSNEFLFAHTNKYENLLPDWMFIYCVDFDDYTVDIIFRDDYSSLEYEIIDWYKYLNIPEIRKQKQHLLDNWKWIQVSKHNLDIKMIDNYLTKI